MSDVDNLFEKDFIPTTRYKTGFVEVEKKEKVKVQKEKPFVLVDDEYKLNIKLYDRHNLAKLKLLSMCARLQKDNIVINSVRLIKLLNRDRLVVNVMLNKYCVRFPYLKRRFDKDRTDGCYFKYELAKEGWSVLKKLSERYEKSLDLNLKRRSPEKVRFFNI